MPREPRFERRERDDRAFLARIALDLACCQERAITLANRAGHQEPIPRKSRRGAAGLAAGCRAGQVPIFCAALALQRSVLAAGAPKPWQPCISGGKSTRYGPSPSCEALVTVLLHRNISVRCSDSTASVAGLERNSREGLCS